MSTNPSPIRTKTGDIGCPRCETKLVDSKSPFHINREYVGKFESLECPICHYFVLTSKGYDNATSVALGFGMIGPREDPEATEIMKVPDVALEELTIPYPVSGNYNKIANIMVGGRAECESHIGGLDNINPPSRRGLPVPVPVRFVKK